MALGEPKHVDFIQNTIAEMTNQAQGLRSLHNHLLYHPLLSFPPQGRGKRIPDPVMAADVHDLVEVYMLCKYLLRGLTDIILQLAGARLDSILQADMDEVGIKGGHEGLGPRSPSPDG